MLVDTCRFGELEIDPDTIIALDEGLFGFTHTRRYCLLEHTPESPFRWLQSVEDADVAFLVVDPMDFFGDYAVELDDAQADNLGLADPDDAAVLNIVTIAENYGDTTVNLLAPIVINTKTRRARQVILENEAYGTQHRLVEVAQQKARDDAAQAERVAAEDGE